MLLAVDVDVLGMSGGCAAPAAHTPVPPDAGQAMTGMVSHVAFVAPTLSL